MLPEVSPFPLPDPVPVPVPLMLPVPVPIPRPVLPSGVCSLLATPVPCATGTSVVARAFGWITRMKEIVLSAICHPSHASRTLGQVQVCCDLLQAQLGSLDAIMMHSMSKGC